MCLSSTSLPICNNSRVVSFQHWDHTVLSCVIVNKLLGRYLVVNIIKCKVLPHAQVRVHSHISLLFFLRYFCTQVLHDSHWFVVCANLHDWSEVAASNLFTLKWWSDSNNYFKIRSRRMAWALRGIEHTWLISLVHHILLLILDHLCHIAWLSIIIIALNHRVLVVVLVGTSHLLLITLVLNSLGYLTHVYAHIHIIHYCLIF